MPFPDTNPSLARALADRGYAEPTPVQAAVMAPEAHERDLLVSAQTGSGKTVAYGLAFASTLLGDAERFGPAGEPLALMIAPTRELALQVQRELIWLYGPAGARIASCVGGMDVRREARALADGCHMVVATPGRLRDHLERGRLDPSKLKVVVLDEADEMLDLGFREDLEFILDATPAERRTLLFSATLPRGIVALARRYQRDAVRIDTIDQSQPHGDIEYRAVRIAPNEIEHAVVNVLRYFEMRGAMVFCHTREAVRHLHASLQERGFSVVALSGELTQNERSHALQALRDGRARVCVATDVAARGIDLPDLGLVIHADLPNDPETLLHRSGRTGRAGRKGVCVLLVPYTRRRKAERLVMDAKIDAAWGPPPTADEIRAGDQQRLIDDPAFSEETTEEDLAMARALIAGRSAEEIAAALVRLYRARLPAPEDLVDAGPPPRQDRRAERDTRDARDARGPRERRERDGDPSEPAPGMVWFRMNVGRRNNADPRWLLPIICRLGHVTKKDVGTIRIFDQDTRFEIAEGIAQRFAAAVRKAPDNEDIRIEPATAAFEGGARKPKGTFKGGPKEGFKGKHRGADGPYKAGPRKDGPGKGGPGKGGPGKAGPRKKPKG
ncbi:MAG TPA: DEAD/DEAH box helicase [Microvirga sp.]|jgi:ATP-dependent RNA helicase DeaD